MLEKLKEYKEIIAIITFFLGGFFWLDKQFPTKDDLNAEIASVNCLLEKYMTLTQLQIRVAEHEKQIRQLNKRISDALQHNASGTGEQLSPAMRMEIDQMKSDIEGKRSELRNNTVEMEDLTNELARNVFGGNS